MNNFFVRSFFWGQKILTFCFAYPIIASMQKKQTVEKFRKIILPSQSVMDAVRVEKKAFKMQGESYYPLYIIRREGKIIGFENSSHELVAIKEILRGYGESMYCYGTAVLPKFRRKGLGTLLTKFWEKEAVALKIKWLFTLVSPNNGANLNSYINKAGFKAISFAKAVFGEKNDYGYGVDHLLLAKRVGSGHVPDIQKIEKGLDDDTILAIGTKYQNNGYLRKMKAICDSQKAALKKSLFRGAEIIALVRKHQINRSLRGGKNIFIVRKKNSNYPDFLPFNDKIDPQLFKKRIRRLKTNRECDKALAIEKHYLPEATIYHLRSISIVHNLFGKFKSNRLVGIFGFLFPFSAKEGAYLHGPFEDMFCKSNSCFMSEALDYAEKSAFENNNRKLWTIIPSSRTKQSQILFDFLTDRGFSIESEEKEMFKNTSGLIISKKF